jgi:hypothetical protein
MEKLQTRKWPPIGLLHHVVFKLPDVPKEVHTSGV